MTDFLLGLEEFFSDSWVYINPMIEIFILAFIIYRILYFLKDTRGSSILSGIMMMLICFTMVLDYVKLEVLNWMLTNLWSMLSVMIIVIFQPELRRGFAHLGATAIFASKQKEKKKELLNEVSIAVENMAKTKTGALLVFEREISMSSIVTSYVSLSAKLNSLLIETIFFHNSPLHDGALIVKDDKIIAGHAILPLSQDQSLLRTMGTRHRAALGITEETDAVALVVSEETGQVSIAVKNRMKKDIPPSKVHRYLSTLLLSTEKDSIKDIFGTMAENDERVASGLSALHKTSTNIAEDI
jgi:diadenylate cyclase